MRALARWKWAVPAAFVLLCLLVSGDAAGVTARRVGVAAQGVATPPNRLAFTWRRHINLLYEATGRRQLFPRADHVAVVSLSPHGQWLAYVRVKPHTVVNGWAAGQLWLARADGAGAHPLTDGKTCVGELSWAPGGRRLAFYHADAVMVYDTVARRSRMVLRYKDSPPCESTSNDNSLAWSPDGRRIAAMATWAGAGYPQILRLVIADVTGSAARTVTIRFARGALGGSGPRDPGSHPVGAGLAWTADGRHVLFMTIGKGMGWTPTGIWQAPAAGGLARLLIGSASGVRDGNMNPQPVPPLYRASYFALSPDRRFVALDPGNRLWVAHADGTGGRFLNLGIRYSCGATQFTWLADSSGLAYVREYYIPGGMRFVLYSIHLHGGRPRLLFKGDDGVLGALYLAPWQRSCGAGA